jgi:hypothetical protein
MGHDFTAVPNLSFAQTRNYPVSSLQISAIALPIKARLCCINANGLRLDTPLSDVRLS